ncbi:MAG: hypothetical protein H7Y89_20475 [Steroidobacteraceae bacterium]|nr:hypothetical protein [Steroidobacteraceae bacterium]
MNIRFWQRAVATLVAVSYLAGCASLQNVPLGQSSSKPAVEVGESVVVTTKAGEKKSFTVTSVESNALVGANSRVSYAEIERLDVKRGGMTPGKRGLLIGAAVLGVIAVAAAAGGGGGGSGGGY